MLVAQLNDPSLNWRAAESQEKLEKALGLLHEIYPDAAQINVVLRWANGEEVPVVFSAKSGQTKTEE